MLSSLRFLFFFLSMKNVATTSPTCFQYSLPVCRAFNDSLLPHWGADTTRNQLLPIQTIGKPDTLFCFLVTAPARLQVRALVSALMKDAVPASWKIGLVQAAMGAASWVDDLGKRIGHLESVSKPGAKSGADASPYWLGGLFNPDAFVTASRQHVARALSCSLEELKLSLVVGPAEENSAAGGDCRYRVVKVLGLPAGSCLYWRQNFSVSGVVL